MISAPDRAGLLAPSRSAAARIARPVLSSELVEGVGKVLKVQARGTTDAGKLLGPSGFGPIPFCWRCTGVS